MCPTICIARSRRGPLGRGARCRTTSIEVVSAIRRLAASGEASSTRAVEAIADLLDLPLVRYPHDILVPRIWELRDNFSSRDAAYLALAESLTDEGVPLLTTDVRLARATRAHTGVEVLAV